MTKRRNKKNQWQKKTLRLKDNHNWQAPKGYKIVVLDRGAVSFNVPQGWIVEKTEPFTMHNAEPPDDDARLTVSFWRTAPGIDWSKLPLPPLLEQSVPDDDEDHDVLERGDVVIEGRTDLELVWMVQRFLDPAEKREAYTRVAMARGWDVHVLITGDFWVDDMPRFQPMWDEVLRSLQLGRVIEDPTRGAVTH
jgi:hypothetical protein